MKKLITSAIILGLAGNVYAKKFENFKNIDKSRLELRIMTENIDNISLIADKRPDLAFLLLENKAHNSKEPLEVNNYAIYMAHDFGKVDEAISYFEKAIKLGEKMLKKGKETKGNLAVYYANLAIHQELYKKNFKEAEKNYLKAFSLDSKAEYADNLAILYYKTKQYEKAVKYWKITAEKTNDISAYVRILSVLINKLRDYDKAKIYLKKALKLYTESNLFKEYENKIKQEKYKKIKFK